MSESPFDVIYKEGGAKVFFKFSEGGLVPEEVPEFKGFTYRDEAYVRQVAAAFFESHPERRNEIIKLEELKAYDEATKVANG